MITNVFRSLHESPRGFNFRFVIDHTDLTQATDNTTQAISLISLPATSVIKSAATFLKTPFQLVGTAAYNSNALIVGDNGDADRCIISQQINANGTFVTARAQASTIPFAFAAPTAILATFASMASHDLLELNAGEVHIFLEVAQLDTLT